MDELTFDDKKYISTKLAAKVTGYAKDYVGQLCREGRVPARQVGRSWYVQESAIRDHRFGSLKNEKEISAEEEKKYKTTSISSTWDAPRYEAVEAEQLPQVHRPKEVLDSPKDPIKPTDKNQLEQSENPALASSLQKGWDEWFSNIKTSEKEVNHEMPTEIKITKVPTTDIESSSEEKESVPLHVFHENEEPIHREEEKVPDSSIEVEKNIAYTQEEELPTNPVSVERRKGGFLVRSFVGLLILIALATTSFAIIASGYTDTYMVSFKPATFITGISIYNK